MHICMRVCVCVCVSCMHACVCAEGTRLISLGGFVLEQSTVDGPSRYNPFLPRNIYLDFG